MATWQFAPVPDPLITAVRRELPAIVAAVVTAVSAESATYGDVLSGPEGLAIRLGIEGAVGAFLDGAAAGRHPSAEADELWRRLGENEFQSGRDLEVLRSVFRTGTRALWREAARVAAAAGMPTELVLEMAEAIFVYTDELAVDVVEGFLRAQSDEAGELERRRRRVVALLTAPEGVDLNALSRAASLAGWSVPRRVAVLALAAQSPVTVARHVGPEVLVGADGEGAYLVLPDPEGPGNRERLERAVAGQVCALGPTVAPEETGRSLRWARSLLTLVDNGTLVSEGMLPVEEHLADLILLRDGDLADAVVRRHLGVLEALAPAERDRLEATLGAWLAHQRHTPSVARELHVHPQTVRYRIHRLRELFGPRLESGEGRFELELALRIRGAQGDGSATS